MSNLVLPAVGAIVGGIYGGPPGAALGWSLGTAIQGPEDIEQPAIGDLRIQTSQYGAVIPALIGRQRISGNIIWSSPKRTYEIKEQAGKGGGPTAVSTGYKIDMCIALCEGEITGVSRVWANEQVVVNSGGKLPGAIYLGSTTQNPDPTMEAHEGAGAVPAYRGLAYIMIDDYDLGVTGAIPQFSFEIVRNGGF